METQALRVLIVESQPDGKLSYFLRTQAHYAVETVRNYEQACDYVAHTLIPYHVILIDENIPSFDGDRPRPIGVDLLRTIKSNYPKTGFLLFRGEGTPYNLESALDAGAFHYLPRSTPPQEIATLIRSAAQHQWAAQVAALQSTALKITSCADPAQLFETIIAEAVQLLQAKDGGLYRYYPDRQHDHLEIVARYKRPPTLGTTVAKGEGLAGRLVLQGQPDILQTPDYDASEYRIQRFADNDGYPSRSMIAVRLTWREKIIGALYVNDNWGRVFNQHEENMLRTYAHYAAFALDNYELAQQNQGKLRRLEQLSQATTHIMGSLGSATLDEQLRMIAQHAVEILRAEVCRVFLVVRPGWLSARASYGDKGGGFIHDEEYPIRSQHRGGLTSYIADQGEIFQDHGETLNSNPYSDGDLPDHLPSVLRHSLLAVPLKHEGQLIGLLRIENKQNQQGYATPTIGFSDEDVWILRIFAETVVSAIQNAQLVRRQNLLLQAIGTVSEAGDPMEGLQKFTEMLPALFDHTFCRVSLMHANGHSLQTKAAHSRLHAEQQPHWNPGLSRHAGMPAWIDWNTVLEGDTPTVFSLSTEQQQSMLQRVSDLLELPMPVQRLLVMPLKTAGETVGFLEVGEVRHGERYGFTQEHQSLIAAVATQITPLVNALRLQEIAEHDRQAATTIAEVAAQGDRDVMRAIARGILEAVACDAITLYGYDTKTRQLSNMAMVGVKHPERLSLSTDIFTNPIFQKAFYLDKPYIVPCIAADSLFRYSSFAREEGIQACIIMPLQAAETHVGFMFVNYRRPQQFPAALIATLRLFADQAAVTLQNVQLHTRTQKQQAILEATRRANHAVHRALDLVLDEIAEQAWHATNERDPHSGFASIWLRQDRHVVFQSAYPRESFDQSILGIGARRVQDVGRGIIGKTIGTGAAQFVEDVTDNPDYLPTHRGTRSEFAVPIKIDSEAVGVINVEYFYLKNFNEDDQHALEALAIHASTALQNAKRDAELRRMQALVTARTALAWMGLASSTALHSIQSKVNTILDLVELALRNLQAGQPLSTLERRLHAIATAAHKMQETPIPALSSSGADVQLVPINALVHERLIQLQQQEPRYRGVKCKEELSQEASLFVRANPEWLRKALTIPLDNAVRAMECSWAKRLTVKTCVQGSDVEIHICDTGPGIPTAIQPLLLHEPIPKPPDAPGMGMGLLMAHTIVQAYEGSMELRDTGPGGTTMVIRLPRVGEDPSDRGSL